MDNLKSKGEDRERASSVASRATTSLENSREKLDDLEKASTVVGSPQASPQHDPPTNTFKPEADLEKLPGHGKQRVDSEPVKFGGEEEDPNVGVPFHRSSTPSTVHKSKGFAYQNVGENGFKRMHKFSLYETSSRYYLVGADIMEKQYRVLKIDRTSPPGLLSIFEDDIVYNRREMHQLLSTIDDGNKSTGGMKLKCSAWGLLGFIRFTEAYYMLLITKRNQVAMLGGHYVYQVDGTDMIPLTTGSTSRFQKDRNPEEARFLTILNNMDLTRSFYFSYSYNVTRSLQQNIIKERSALNNGTSHPERDFQDMFVWNNHLLDPAREALKNVYDWCHPVIHGYVDQASLDVFGRRIYLTIVARRSRFFAGARFLKRGTNDCGYVANDVETEQIVSDALTTSFHAPGPRLFANPTYTSYVQHRGSIPVYWTQDNTGVTPKPDIDLNLADPFYSAAALHFDNLFERYGSPIYVLNLIKARERTPRESKLLYEYKSAIEYLNQSLPKENKIIYEAFDMSRAAKTRGGDVIGTLESLAEKVLQTTSFFHNGDDETDSPRVQNGVARTNCIDCLDRTNAAQFVIGKKALGHQLQALGIIAGNAVEYDSDCVDMFTQMFHGHGDAIAIQYGGSHLVNTMATYRKINQWQSSSRDMVESFKRYYHNSFLDNQRQEAYNLFLGHYIYIHGQPMLWELTTDYYLHHEDPKGYLSRHRRDYINWFTPANLQPRVLPPVVMPYAHDTDTREAVLSARDDYWLEYYRPLAISSFLKIFAFRLASPRVGRDSRDGTHPSRKENLSPFVPRRKQHDHDHGREGRKGARKGVTIIDPLDETQPRNILDRRRRELLLNVPHTDSPVKHSILREAHFETQMPLSAPATLGSFPSLSNSASTSTGLSSSLRLGFKPADKAQINQWTLAQFYDNSMNPTVSALEEDEYSRYIEHPLNLPLVVTNEMPSADDPSAMEYYDYLSLADDSIQPPRDFDADSTHTSYLPIALDTDFASLRSFASHATHTTTTRPPTSHSIATPFSHAPYSYPHLHPHGPSIPHTTPAAPRFQTADSDIEEFEEFIKVREDPLDVSEEDNGRKRYKAYRQWLRGKSFFKQSKVDPEWRTEMPVR
ncbi:phosphatidylinositol-3,5-bisphosphate 5-phosphatase [Coniothyrium glycines]